MLGPSTVSVMDREKFAREFDHRSLRLSPELQRVYDENPHLQQVFANSKCWMGIQGTLRAGAEPERSALSNAWLDSDAGRDWLTLVSG